MRNLRTRLGGKGKYQRIRMADLSTTEDARKKQRMPFKILEEFFFNYTQPKYRIKDIFSIAELPCNISWGATGKCALVKRESKSRKQKVWDSGNDGRVGKKIHPQLDSRAVQQAKKAASPNSNRRKEISKVRLTIQT